jgi:hypothetical protein
MVSKVHAHNRTADGQGRLVRAIARGFFALTGASRNSRGRRASRRSPFRASPSAFCEQAT